MVLVGNKADLETERVVSSEQDLFEPALRLMAIPPPPSLSLTHTHRSPTRRERSWQGS